MLNKIFLLAVMLTSFYSSFAQTDSIVEERNDLNKSMSNDKNANFYMAGQYFRASRSFEDVSGISLYDSVLFQQPLNTGGFEFGTFIKLSEGFNMSVGFNYYGGGECWGFSDSLSDSTYTYNNKYRQVAIPIRLQIEFGEAFKSYSFVGVIPSSILGRRYSSSYANSNGTVTENDVLVIHDNINSFQFSGAVGTGLSYDFDGVKVFAHVEYRHHFTNTYVGLYLKHYQKLIGGAFGLAIDL